MTVARATPGRPRRLALLAPLRTRPAYRRLCVAAAISETGDWLLFIALPLYVLHASGSALNTSGVFLAELVPGVVVGALGGPLIDRLPAARLLAGLTLVQAALLAPLLWVGAGQLWIIYAVAGLQAAATSLTVPAMQAVVPALVDGPELPGANALVEVASNAARLVGSPLGGALLPVLGLHGLVAGDMASFVVAAALLARVKRPAAAAEPDRDRSASAPRGAGLAAGWRTVCRHVTLRAAMTIAFLGAVAQGLFLVLFVLFVLRSLHAGDQTVGLLRGVQAIGGVAGGVLVGAWAGRLGARALAVLGLAGFGLISLLTWHSPGLTTAAGWYVALFIAVGLPGVALTTGLITGTQAAAPAPMRGRVLSLLGVAQALGQGTGILLAGLLADSVALGVLLNLQAGCYLACALVASLAFARPPREPHPSP